MLSLALTHLVTDGTLFCIAFGVVVMGSLWWNPRMWLHDYPKEVQAVVPPLTPEEKRSQRPMMVLVLVVMIGLPVYAVLRLRMDSGVPLPFATAYLFTWALLQLVNLFDAVVLDWIILAQAAPKFAILPGTEHMADVYRNPRMHLTNYVKGVIITSILSVPVALAGVL